MFKKDLKQAIKIVKKCKIVINWQYDGFKKKHLQWLQNTQRNVPESMKETLREMIKGISPDKDAWAISEAEHLTALVVILISRMHVDGDEDEEDDDIDMVVDTDEDDETDEDKSEEKGLSVRRICMAMKRYKPESDIWTTVTSMTMEQTPTPTSKNHKNDIYLSNNLIFLAVIDRNSGKMVWELDARAIAVRGFDANRGIMHKTFNAFEKQ